jgi:phenylalanyl-tRNA synthetase alpha chain
MLYKLATRPEGLNGEKGGFKPVKMFSIDRVFRNEATDATHLAEFHQVEGVVADRGITLGDLIGTMILVQVPKSRLIFGLGFMETFFSKMGITNLRFKPAYNPYTEVPALQSRSVLRLMISIAISGNLRISPCS